VRWAASSGASLINLSLGTPNREHAAALTEAVASAAGHDAFVVAAAPQDGIDWLPGGLDTVVGVEADRTLPRDRYDLVAGPANIVRIRASPFPRRLAGVDLSVGFQGPSFAVANATGLLALVLQDDPVRSISCLIERLTAFDRSVS